MQFLGNTYQTARANEVLAKIALISNELQSMETEKANVSVGLSTIALRLGLFSHQFLVDLDRFWQLRDCLPKLDR